MTVAMIVEDEPLLAEELREELLRLWPELTVQDAAHDGVEALRRFDVERPDVLFLDVQLPVLSGLDVARVASARAHVVFITAFDHYAVQAFEQGAVDYILKPVDTARLALAVNRVRSKLRERPADLSRMLEMLRGGNERLQWITVLQGRDIQFIPIDEVCYFRADNKYISVVTAGSEFLITTPLKELIGRLDPSQFWQVHRGLVVNMRAVLRVRRSLTGHLELQLKSRPESLRVSAGHAHLFKHM